MKVGFAAIVGRPNVGKSSLLNALLSYEISIVTSTPQTTRDQIKGIFNDEDSQIIFLDTPGIHKPIQKLSNSLNESAYTSSREADVILFLQPCDEKIGDGDKLIISKINMDKAIAVISKIDLTKDIEILNERASQLKAFGFKTIIATSFKDNHSLKVLIEAIKEKLPEGIPFYDRDQISDASIKFIAKEIIREATIEETSDEIPHSIGVVINEFYEPEKEEDQIKINATIYVERDSQKGIIIGKGGSKIKKIGMLARRKMVDSFGQRVHLDLNVKVNKNWTNDEKEIKKMGY